MAMERSEDSGTTPGEKTRYSNQPLNPPTQYHKEPVKQQPSWRTHSATLQLTDPSRLFFFFNVRYVPFFK
jgi:hypothetical protein